MAADAKSFGISIGVGSALPRLRTFSIAAYSFSCSLLHMITYIFVADLLSFFCGISTLLTKSFVVFQRSSQSPGEVFSIYEKKYNAGECCYSMHLFALLLLHAPEATDAKILHAATVSYLTIQY